MIKLGWKHWFWAGWELGSGCVGLSVQHTSSIQRPKIPGLFRKINAAVSVFCSGWGLAFCMEVPMRLGVHGLRQLASSVLHFPAMLLYSRVFCRINGVVC
jgi:hypothetical protein